MADQARIFLSYAREDIDIVREIHVKLSEAGFKPWMDKEDLLAGQRWDLEIPRALRASDFILIFFSKHSVAKRGYVQREFKLTLDTLMEIPEGNIHTIPIRLDDSAIPEQFSKLHWVDYSDEDAFERIVKALQFGRSALERFATPSGASKKTKRQERKGLFREVTLWKGRASLVAFIGGVVVVSAMVLFFSLSDVRLEKNVAGGKREAINEKEEEKSSADKKLPQENNSPTRRGGREDKNSQLAASIDDLWERFRRQLAEDKLTIPKGNNAFETIEELERRVPGDEKIKEGKQRIKERYIELAEVEERKGDLVEAKLYHKRIRQVDPEYKLPVIEWEEKRKRKNTSSRRALELALMRAAENGSVSDITAQLSAGVDINAKDSKGRTALMRAIDLGHFEVVTVLVRDGADVNQRDNQGTSALIQAAAKGLSNVTHLLLAAGADFKIADQEGKTALIRAVEKLDATTVKELLLGGADIQVSGASEDLVSRARLLAVESFKRELRGKIHTLTRDKVGMLIVKGHFAVLYLSADKIKQLIHMAAVGNNRIKAGIPKGDSLLLEERDWPRFLQRLDDARTGRAPIYLSPSYLQ